MSELNDYYGDCDSEGIDEDDDEGEDCDYGLTEFCIHDKAFCEDCPAMMESNDYWTPSWIQEALGDLHVYYVNFKIRHIDPISDKIKERRLKKFAYKMEASGKMDRVKE